MTDDLINSRAHTLQKMANAFYAFYKVMWNRPYY